MRPYAVVHGAVRKLSSRHGARSSSQLCLHNNAIFEVSEEVREAVHAKQPVVALETTIYTHGEDCRGF